ncbi:MAG: polyamine aminopropyltransferase [Bacteriovoracaceae bacterium]|nr:polyamine aminopropyltransferase [Bacteriovoracaceae bacterium]
MNVEGWKIEESFRNTFAMGFKVNAHLHSEKSEFQQIDVVDTDAVGRLLLLDGKTMVSDKDEFVYHEVVSHIPYMVSRQCKNVLIIGGGDGGVVREFVKHKDIARIDLVEIDERVIEVSKKYFPDCTSGLTDPRVRVLCQDGFAFIKKAKKEYDVIVIDSTDPVDFATALFTDAFYQDVYNALTDDGIMLNQTENPFLDEWGVKDIYNNMRKIFPIVKSFTAPMLVYPGVFWTWGFSSKKFSPTDINPERVSSMSSIEKNLKWYNMDWHRAAFSLSNFHKKTIGQE